MSVPRTALPLRLPPDLAAWCGTAAKRAGISRNDLITRWLSVLRDVADEAPAVHGELDPSDYDAAVAWHVLAWIEETGIGGGRIEHVLREQRRRMEELRQDVELDRMMKLRKGGKR
jgi:hypothetical protein